jgi:hypothetical protein
MADLLFGAWEKSPLGAAVKAVDGGGVLPAAQFSPSVQATGTRTFRASGPELTLLGPGGSLGFDPSVVVRTDPPAGSGDIENNYLACVEFSDRGLPWLLTPARADARNRLRPWIVLVVVEARTAVTPGQPLPTITVSTDELPSLGDSWAWAHVQAPAPGAALPPGIPGVTGQTISRLVCPRRLQPNTHYRACVVPSFAGGRAAGLGESGDVTADHGFAWDVNRDEPVTLPVYYQWEFATGIEGDFEHLVRRLAPASEQELTGIGALPVDLSHPWPRAKPLLDGAPQTASMLGALRIASEPEPGSISEDASFEFVARLGLQLNASADRIVGRPPEDSLADILSLLGFEVQAPAGDIAALSDVAGAVGPPLYGGRHINAERLERVPVEAPPDWLHQLNLDPNQRIAAGVGADYVRRNQEELMARAWEHAGAIREANRRRARAELAAEVGTAMHARHVETLSPGELLGLASPAAARIRTHPTGPTLTMEVAMSPLPMTGAAAALSRLLRRDGPVARRTQAGMDALVRRGLRGQIAVRDPQPLLARLSLSTMPAATDTPMALATSDALEAADVGVAARTVAMMGSLAQVATVNGFTEVARALQDSLSGIDGVDLETAVAFQVPVLTALVRQQLAQVAEASSAGISFMASQQVDDGRVVNEFGVQIEATELRARLAGALAPGEQVARQLGDRVAVPPALERPALQPVMKSPVFPLPTALALLATQPEWFLPGIGAFPGNRTTVLQANPPFIESFLVGLNHEFMRELLWREYPTDRRGTPFRRFWPRPGGEDDIPPIDTWLEGQLGEHSALAGQNVVVLLIRGDVVRRFPDMLVAAAPAAGSGPNTDQATWQAPMFTLAVDASTAAYAFSLDAEQPIAQGDDVYFVAQEHTYRLRFGFDIHNDDFPDWSQLDWDRVPQQRGFAVAGAQLAPPAAAGGLAWDNDASDVARITLQLPFRVAIRAAELLRAGE